MFNKCCAEQIVLFEGDMDITPHLSLLIHTSELKTGNIRIMLGLVGPVSCCKWMT